ncbi:DUF3488 and transglutaminase-like domain-containing protein [Micromonospora sp. NBC_01813]|uniref:DUF3488 and transglutaminase-like domain-containing protein n=1 Tax=Micromonospora sp. NBC_01813 TaxID=2975988 RepID=UPI002DD88B00|nr:transglutaminaseTgpA domain-containing protein [Micromonospora sp. NBC_01813]WSA06263.1 DUF3488 and transglutaminase-like domain-containing protein [Micromonospora sp. NBC_01813]
MSPALGRAVPPACLLLATAVATLLFVPVFGLSALLLPVGATATAMLAVAVVCTRGELLTAWRPLLVAATGVLVVAETVLWSTTIGGLPTGRTLRALGDGITGWQLALQSTWPARPEPPLLLFVPLLAVLAGALGLELLYRLGPLPALAPSLTIVVFSQLYAPIGAVAATGAALGYVAAAGALLAARHPTPRDDGQHPATVRQVAPAAALAVLAACLAGLVVPAGEAPWSLRQDQAAPVTEINVASPLDEIASRLARPDAEAFRVRGATDVDRWSLVVLDAFDGVNWTSTDSYRRLGTDLRPAAAVTVPVRDRSARIDVTGVDGPWLPGQTWPAGVEGVAPLVEERHGTLLLPGDDHPGPVSYTIRWWQPQVDAATLGGAATDPRLPGGLGGVGTVPPGVAELAAEAVRGVRPSFQAALALERHLRDNYRLAVGEDLPTGHGWPQLADFLLRDKRGTSEQFAAAYVALARILGIPARLVVGFRAPTGRDADGGYTVRGGDVLAWPEVAVADVGWVPLDPGGAATDGGAARGGGLAAVTAQARARLPAPENIENPPVAEPRPTGPGRALPTISPPWTVLLAAVAALAVGWLIGVPTAKAGRAWRRRRRPGTAAVVGAWAEARDRLREHGVAVSPAMTVRDLAAAAAPVTSPATVDALRRLAVAVDGALWSSPASPGTEQAWAAVRAVRRGLARRGMRARLRAGLDPRSLLRPH